MANEQEGEFLLALTEAERSLVVEALQHRELYYRDIASTLSNQGAVEHAVAAHRAGDAFMALLKRVYRDAEG